jgi:hypothetical protein
LRRRNVDAWRNATSERFLGLGTAENRALQNRRRETPKFFWLFEKRRKRRRGSDASASKKSSDFRLQRTETTQTTAVRTPRFGLKEESGLPLATNGNGARRRKKLTRPFEKASARVNDRFGESARFVGSINVPIKSSRSDAEN